MVTLSSLTGSVDFNSNVSILVSFEPGNIIWNFVRFAELMSYQ